MVIVWVREGYALPFLALGFLFVDIPELDRTFWLTVASLIPLEVLALVLYVKAIRLSPLSLTIPFMALSPVFIVFIAFVFLGEWPSITGFAGVLMIAVGAYTLNAGASRSGLLGPIKAVAAERGSVLMIIVSHIQRHIYPRQGRAPAFKPCILRFFLPFSHYRHAYAFHNSTRKVHEGILEA
jgi:drug/metabolite transporter (DMT)-like permease